MIKDVILREDVEEVCVWWKILQCYNFLIEGSSGIHLCIQMESFLRHYDHCAEKNFWFGKFCNATLFSSKAALVFICIPRWSDFPEMMMQRRTSDVANSAMLQFSDWRPGLRIICACPNSLMFQRWWQFQCAKFCNATVFSLKVALVIHLHTQMECFFRSAGTSKVANSALLQISSSKVALVIICVYPHGVGFRISLMMQRRTSWFCKEMCTTFSCFFVKHCSHLAWQVPSFIFLIQSESHCAMFTEPSNVGLLWL